MVLLASVGPSPKPPQPVSTSAEAPASIIARRSNMILFSIGVVSLAPVAEQDGGRLAVQLLGEAIEVGGEAAQIADQVGNLRQAIAGDEGVGIVRHLAEFGDGLVHI